MCLYLKMWQYLPFMLGATPNVRDTTLVRCNMSMGLDVELVDVLPNNGSLAGYYRDSMEG